MSEGIKSLTGARLAYVRDVDGNLVPIMAVYQGEIDMSEGIKSPAIGESLAYARDDDGNLVPIVAIDASSLGPNVSAMYFGDGSDGDVTVSTAISLTRDMYYRNLTLIAGCAINVSGFRVFVSGELNIENAPSGAMFIDRDDGGVGAANGTAGTAAVNLPSRTWNTGGVTPRAGGAGGVAAGAAGAAQTTTTYSLGGLAGSTGGAGGSGSGGAGGAVGANSQGASALGLGSMRYQTTTPFSSAAVPNGGVLIGRRRWRRRRRHRWRGRWRRRGWWRHAGRLRQDDPSILRERKHWRHPSQRWCWWRWWRSGGRQPWWRRRCAGCWWRQRLHRLRRARWDRAGARGRCVRWQRRQRRRWCRDRYRWSGRSVRIRRHRAGAQHGRRIDHGRRRACARRHRKHWRHWRRIGRGILFALKQNGLTELHSVRPFG